MIQRPNNSGKWLHWEEVVDANKYHDESVEDTALRLLRQLQKIGDETTDACYKLEEELADAKRLRFHHSPDAIACEECDAIAKRVRELEDIAGEFGAAHDDVVHIEQREIDWLKSQVQQIGRNQPMTGTTGKINPGPDNMMGARESADGVLSRHIGALQAQVRDLQALLKMYLTYTEVGGLGPEDAGQAESALWRLLMQQIPREW